MASIILVNWRINLILITIYEIHILIDIFQSLSIDTADANNSTVILANDPDADRLAIAEKLDRYIFQFMYIQDNKTPPTNIYYYCIPNIKYR